MELTIEQALQQGMTAHREGKLQDAERLYRAILQSQPRHPDANHNLGVLAVSVNRADTALPLFKVALEANPKIEQFWLSYIDALIKEKQNDTAKQVIEQAKKHGVARVKVDALEKQLSLIAENAEPTLPKERRRPTFSEKRREVAEKKRKKKKQDLKGASPSDAEINTLLQQYQNGQYDDAEHLAISLTERFPEHPFSWKVLGVVFKQTGRISESLNTLQKVVQLSPQDAEAHFNFGITLKAQGRLRDAESSYRQAIALKPDFADGHFNLGNTLSELDKLEESATSFKQAIACKPDYAEAYNNLGNALKQLGRLGEAEVSYKQTIALKPDYADAHNNLGATLQELGRLAEAEASYMQAIALNPDYAETHNSLGIMLKELGRLDEAEASYRQAIALKSDFHEAHNNLGNTLQELGRLKEAESSCVQAIALNPDYAEAHSNLGVIFKELGRLDEAEASYKQAIALKPGFALAHYNLGVTLQELGRLDEAEASYTQAIALKANFVEALRNRGLLLLDKKEFEAALKDADLCISKGAIELDLTALYALGRIEEIYKRIEIRSKVDRENRSVAAFAAFIAEAEKKNTSYDFCSNPIDFIHVANLSSHVKDSVAYVAGVIEELNKVETIWEPSGKTTVGGFQSLHHMNLFKSPSGKIEQLKSIIIDELNSYKLKFCNESCAFIQKWPSNHNLHGWYVTLKHQGYQNAHIHPSGWLSGVIYLKVVPSLGKNEGAIEFSLNSEYYRHENAPSVIIDPKEGDIILFPSSLHHRTVPFTTNADRIIVSFDLKPEEDSS